MERSTVSEDLLFDTYVAALQHDLVEFPDDTRRIGVVRRPTPWFSSVVDENEPALGPPDPLLDDMKQRYETLLERGLNEVTAHNRAMVGVDYDRRYHRHLTTSDEAEQAIDRVHHLLAEEIPVALVCYENTDEKRCHRTDLRELLAERL